MSKINVLGRRFRREKPESSHLIVSRILGVIFYIVLIPLAYLIVGLDYIYEFILRIARKFTGKEREKL